MHKLNRSWNQNCTDFVKNLLSCTIVRSNANTNWIVSSTAPLVTCYDFFSTSFDTFKPSTLSNFVFVRGFGFLHKLELLLSVVMVSEFTAPVGCWDGRSVLIMAGYCTGSAPMELISTQDGSLPAHKSWSDGSLSGSASFSSSSSKCPTSWTSMPTHFDKNFVMLGEENPL